MANNIGDIEMDVNVAVGLVAVEHDKTLVGNGTVGSPLGVNPDEISGAEVNHDDTLVGDGSKDDPLGVASGKFVEGATVMPVADVSLENKTVFYVGEDGIYKKGRTYVCKNSQLIVDYTSGQEFVKDIDKFVNKAYQEMNLTPELNDRITMEIFAGEQVYGSVQLMQKSFLSEAEKCVMI